MSVEGENVVPKNSDKPAVLSPEVLAGQERLRQKIKIQEKVMEMLGFVPASFDLTGFSTREHELPEAQEAKARSWSGVENKDNKSRSDVFKELYAIKIIKYPEPVLTTEHFEEIVEEIAGLIRAREGEWS